MLLYAVKEASWLRPRAVHTRQCLWRAVHHSLDLTVIVSLKYVTLVLRADNHGEGGLVAMLALASQSVKDRPELRRVLLLVGIFGTCLFYGDGAITPAISVLAAVEGMEVISPALHRFVIPITPVILLVCLSCKRAALGDSASFLALSPWCGLSVSLCWA